VAIDRNRVRQIRVRLRGVINVCVSCCGLRTSELNSERRFGLPLQIALSRVKRDCPVIHIAIAIVRLRTYRVSVSAENAPVDIVEISRYIALADFEVDAFREVGWIVVRGPVDAVFFGV
jgi:hypothetical protein